jgi:hypothetical protein
MTGHAFGDADVFPAVPRHLLRAARVAWMASRLNSGRWAKRSDLARLAGIHLSALRRRNAVARDDHGDIAAAAYATSVASFSSRIRHRLSSWTKRLPGRVGGLTGWLTSTTTTIQTRQRPVDAPAADSGQRLRRTSATSPPDTRVARDISGRYRWRGRSRSSTSSRFMSWATFRVLESPAPNVLAPAGSSMHAFVATQLPASPPTLGRSPPSERGRKLALGCTEGYCTLESCKPITRVVILMGR